MRVLDNGPIPYREIALFGDLSLEQGLRHFGVEPSETSYRLIELPIAHISDAASMPYNGDQGIVAAVNQGVEFPPLVVFRNWKRDGWSLLDGANRTNAYVVLGIYAALAYELVLDGLSLDSLLH